MLGEVREPGLIRALRAMGGVRATARAMGLHHSSVAGWRRCPRGRLFELARLSGLEPREIRPDLAGWAEAVRQAAWLERARGRFALGGAGSGAAAAKATVTSDRAPGRTTMDLVDLGVIAAATRFAAGERGLTPQAIMGAPRGAGGAPSPEQSARAYAMALAIVAGRVGSEAVGALFGVTRQAADNAAERYLRAREGDEEAEAKVGDGRVIERGRLRRAKTADPALWAAERRFLAQLGGEA